MPVISKEDLAFLSLSAASRAIANGSVSSAHLVEQALRRIARYDGAIRSFIEVRGEAAAEAEEADRLIRDGRRMGPLHGIPVAVKDLFETRGRSATFGAPHFSGRAGTDAAVIRRLGDAGAIIIGYNNLDEFAFGSFNANEHYGQAANPWDMVRTPGGSSGGSAAAVAAGFACAAIGTDTGVSIRQPAAYCNLVGLKPTFGLVDATGAEPFSTSLDHIGPITRTVEDSALMLSIMMGSNHGMSADGAVVSNEIDQHTRNLKGVRVGVPSDYFLDRSDPVIEALFRAAVGVLQTSEAEIGSFHFAHWEELNAVAAIICRAEAAAFHRRAFKERPSTFGSSMRDFLTDAMKIEARDYAEALERKARLTTLYEETVGEFDVIATPTSPQLPAPIAEGPALHQALRWRCTGPFATVGVPAVSIPCGFSADGLPVGLQLVGRRWRDIDLLGIAAVYEANTTWHLRTPPYPA